MCLGLLAGDIKRKEMLSGRLADIHSHMFIATAILKFYEHGQRSEAEQLHAQLALDETLYLAQEAFFGLFDNFPIPIASGLVKFGCFPFGRPLNKPSDRQKSEAAELIMQNNPFRDYLKTQVYYSVNPQDAFGRMEATFNLLTTVENEWNHFKKAESKGEYQGLTFEERLADAVSRGAIQQDLANKLAEYNALRYDSMLTDIFDEKLERVLELDNPHLHQT
jgi:acyl-CoA dehydrogenase